MEAASAGVARVSVQYFDEGKPVLLSKAVSVHAGRNIIDLPIDAFVAKMNEVFSGSAS